ncbi:hypothetical protein BDB00DRAFT_860348 [Zychaea mexicana]|uniref:uncharacterized protein n=1 Tax=Zychaea mexicana TaxID=64656 RepID=UPI0022FEA0C7|nr:uncharacterized protein BDB00DRAFT_860348 [Zychaea mexicana]KAI9474825.1 hypothetical protein BDB00DRAFT_860348 [Zychaea mexicana]
MYAQPNHITTFPLLSSGSRCYRCRESILDSALHYMHSMAISFFFNDTSINSRKEKTTSRLEVSQSFIVTRHVFHRRKAISLPLYTNTT